MLLTENSCTCMLQVDHLLKLRCFYILKLLLIIFDITAIVIINNYYPSQAEVHVLLKYRVYNCRQQLLISR